MKIVLLAHVFATLFMVGLIWFVQIVHYPLYANVGREQFPEYERLHNRLTTWVVGPAMLLELATAIAIVKMPLSGTQSLAWVDVVLIGLIWLSTAMLSVPAHASLTVEFSTAAYQKLVSTNWIRTVAWSVRGVIVLIMTFRNFSN